MRRHHRAQELHHLGGRHVLQRHHVGDPLIAPGGIVVAQPGALLGLGLGDDFDDTARPFDRAEARRLDGRQKNLVGRLLLHRLGGDDRHLALNARVDQEIAAGDLRHGFHERMDVGVLEIEQQFAGLERRRGWGWRDHQRRGRGRRRARYTGSRRLAHRHGYGARTGWRGCAGGCARHRARARRRQPRLRGFALDLFFVLGRQLLRLGQIDRLTAGYIALGADRRGGQDALTDRKGADNGGQDMAHACCRLWVHYFFRKWLLKVVLQLLDLSGAHDLEPHVT